jgi:hypothetical protein
MCVCVCVCVCVWCVCVCVCVCVCICWLVCVFVCTTDQRKAPSLPDLSRTLMCTSAWISLLVEVMLPKPPDVRLIASSFLPKTHAHAHAHTTEER